MTYICEKCGARLDPGERCDCSDIRVVHVTVDGVVEVKEIDGSIESLQALVGGYIEHVPGCSVGALVNEEGIILDLPQNPYFPEVFGDVVLIKEAAYGEDAFGSLTEFEAKKLLEMLKARRAEW